MKPYSHTAAGRTRHPSVSLAMLVLAPLLVACLAATGAMAQTGGQTDPAAVVTAFNAAVTNQDRAGALAYLDPAFRYRSGPGTALPTDRTKADFLGPMPWQRIVQENIHPIDANTVEMDITFIGGPIPPLPHPFKLHATFTVENGLITEITDQLSPQTAQDLAALPPPSGAPATMPATGAGDLPRKVLLLVLGLSCGLIGAGFRRTSLRRR